MHSLKVVLVLLHNFEFFLSCRAQLFEPFENITDACADVVVHEIDAHIPRLFFHSNHITKAHEQIACVSLALGDCRTHSHFLYIFWDEVGKDVLSYRFND